MYPQEIVLPMKEQLTDNGFQELLTSSEVDDQLQKTGTTLVMVNSVCGCSAGSARPASGRGRRGACRTHVLLLDVDRAQLRS